MTTNIGEKRAQEPIVQGGVRPQGEKRRSSWPTLVIVGVVLGLLIVVPFWLLRPRTETYTLRSYETATVAKGSLVDYVRGSGTLEPRLTRNVSAAGKGILSEWRVAEGDEVKAEQVIGRLSSDEVHSEVVKQEQALESAVRKIAEAELERATAEAKVPRNLAALEAERAEAQRALQIEQKLFELGASSRETLEASRLKDARAEQALLDAQLDAQAERKRTQLMLTEAQVAQGQAERELALAREREAGLELRAPLTGRIIALKKAAGDTVESGAVLATVASSTDVLVNTKLGEAEARRVSVGQGASVRVAGQDFPVTVKQVSPQAEASSSGKGSPTVEVVLTFDAPPQNVRVGASAAVQIEVGRKDDALYLPREPYLSTGGERLAYTVQGDQAVRQTVVFGLVDGARIEVKDGLSEGQKIVSSSYEAFKQHQTIKLVPEGEIQ